MTDQAKQHPLVFVPRTNPLPRTLPDMLGVSIARRMEIEEVLSVATDAPEATTLTIITAISNLPLTEQEYACVLIQLGALFERFELFGHDETELINHGGIATISG